MSRAERKQAYFQKLAKLLDEYTKIVIVGADNVGSNQMQRIRKALRGKGVILMGKNTMVRKSIRGLSESNPKLQAILPYVKGNVGLIFVKDDLSIVKKTVDENKVAAPAKVGAICPDDVIVPAGPTGMEPTQTSFLQALNIPSKIVKGQVDILNDVKLLVKGQKVGSSESALLVKLNIKPFQYGLLLEKVYDDGSIYDPIVLQMTDEDIIGKFRNAVKNVACVSLATGIPTVASLPHSVGRGYKNVLSVALATDYSFPKADEIKKFLANPGAFATTTTTKTQEKPKVEEKKKVVVEEPAEEEDMGLGLFD
jgi:large subunit ribosomal protein LP0